jgi:hypothetical protein
MAVPPPTETEVEAEYIAALGALLEMVKDKYDKDGISFREIERMLSNTFHIGYIEGYKRDKRLARNTPDIV